MSSELINLKRLVDVRIDGAATQRTRHDVILGGSNMVRQTFDATSATAVNLDFVIQTPGLGVYMSRRVNCEVDIPFRFDISVPATAPPGTAKALQFGREWGLSSLPLNSMITTGTVQISTSNFTTQMRQSLPVIKRYIAKKDIRKRLGEVPTAFSPVAIIPPSTLGAGSDYDSILRAGARDSSDPFGNCSSVSVTQLTNANGVYTPVASTATWPPVGISPNGSLTVYGTLHISEPLLIQPFSIDDEVPGFINTNLINVRLNLADLATASVLKFAQADATGYIINNVQVDAARVGNTMASSARLVCQFTTPPVSVKPPLKSIYPTTFFNPLGNPQRFSTALAPWNGISRFKDMTSAEVRSQTITLNTAPDMLAIYFVPDTPATMDGNPAAGLPAQTGGASLEQLCMPFKQLQISWNNNPSLLATFDVAELWRRTNQNGLQSTFQQFQGFLVDNGARTGYDKTLWGNVVSGSGSPVLLALNKDIPVESGVAAGVAGVYTLQVTAQVVNNLPYTVAGGTFVVCPITSQYLILNMGSTSDVIATTATEDAVMNLEPSGDVQAKQYVSAGLHMIGGSMLASSRPHMGHSGVLDMVHRSSATVGGPGLAGYVGAKKPRFEL